LWESACRAPLDTQQGLTHNSGYAVREGAKVVIADILEEGKRLEAELQTTGGEALFVRS